MKYRYDILVHENPAEGTLRWRPARGRFPNPAAAWDAADNRTDAWRIVECGKHSDRILAYGPGIPWEDPHA